MAKNLLITCLLVAAAVAIASQKTSAQDDQPAFRVTVNMVQLNVAITDNKGNYVTNLRPEDFLIAEDGIPEKIATFGEGDNPVRRVGEAPATAGAGETPD